MKPIYYRVKDDGECYKVQLNDDITEREMDSILDILRCDLNEFITEKDFSDKNYDLMDIQIKNESETKVIGVLTMRKEDLSCKNHI